MAGASHYTWNGEVTTIFFLLHTTIEIVVDGVVRRCNRQMSTIFCQIYEENNMQRQLTKYPARVSNSQFQLLRIFDL